MAPNTFAFPPPPPPPPQPQFSAPNTDYGFRGQRGGGRGRGSGRGAVSGGYSRFPGHKNNLKGSYGNGRGYSNANTLPGHTSNNLHGNVAYYNPSFIQRNVQVARPQAQANGYLGGPLFGKSNQPGAHGEASSSPDHTRLTPQDSPGSCQDINGKRNYNDAFPRKCSQRTGSLVSPAVPSFGAPLPTSKNRAANAQIPGKANKKSRNSAVNALGLTPAPLGCESSSGEEDDVDEVLMLVFCSNYRATAESDFWSPASANRDLQIGIKTRLRCYKCSIISPGVGSKYSVQYRRLIGR